MLHVSPQSVSKWERGETYPDITLLPALANLYKTSIDALIGMDKINDAEAKTSAFAEAHAHMRNEDYSSAAEGLSDALRIFPHDEGLMADLAMAQALDKDGEKIPQAISLCERILSGGPNAKIQHTVRAALSIIHMKSGEKEKAVAVAKNLPHVRESREAILAELEKTPSPEEMDAYLKFIALGEEDEQDIIEIDFGMDIVPIVPALLDRIGALREALKAQRMLPRVRVRDNPHLASERVRVRFYADYLLDKTFSNTELAVDEIIAILQKTAR